MDDESSTPQAATGADDPRAGGDGSRDTGGGGFQGTGGGGSQGAGGGGSQGTGGGGSQGAGGGGSQGTGGGGSQGAGGGGFQGAGRDGVHVVVGAGAIGSGIARLLLAEGRRVTLVTRSGSGPADAGIERPADAGIECRAADAADAQAMADLARGAAAIYNCANPPYHRWPELWPPIASSLLGAAEVSGAVLVTISNLYGYGPASASTGTVGGYSADNPMTEQTPLAATGSKGKVRAQMWRDALAAHEAGRVRATEIRASDYVGAGANSVLGDRVVPSLLRGKAVTVLGRKDRLHTWSYTGDVATLAVRAATEPKAWGRAWHVPSGPPRSQHQAVDDLARVAGVRPVPVRELPGAMLYGIGLVSPLMRELRETQYQFSEDFVMDSSAARLEFGGEPTGWDIVLTEVLRSFGPAGNKLT